MSTPDAEEKARNREIAQNEAHREAVSAVRVSGWAIFITIVIARDRRRYRLGLDAPLTLGIHFA